MDEILVVIVECVVFWIVVWDVEGVWVLIFVGGGVGVLLLIVVGEVIVVVNLEIVEVLVGDEVDYVCDCIGVVGWWIVFGYYFDMFDCFGWDYVRIDWSLVDVSVGDVVFVDDD